MYETGKVVPKTQVVPERLATQHTFWKLKCHWLSSKEKNLTENINGSNLSALINQTTTTFLLKLGIVVVISPESVVNKPTFFKHETCKGKVWFII